MSTHLTEGGVACVPPRDGRHDVEQNAQRQMRPSHQLRSAIFGEF